MDGDAHLALLHHLPCSGGTIISRALAAMRGVALLSEAHANMSMGRKGLPLKQAQCVYGLVTREDVHADFIGQIRLIQKRAIAKGMQLIVRDHYAADFLSEDYSALTTRDALAPHFAMRCAFTVRHPVDVWLGLVEKNWIGVPIDQYLKRSLVAARHTVDAGFERYEDFVLSPDDVLGRLCDRLGVTFDGSWRDRIDAVDHITGASGRQGSEIAARPRRAISDADMAQFTRSADYATILEMLGYRE